MLSYKFRMYPNTETKKTLEHLLELCMSVYNRLLNEINEAKKENRKITQKDTQKLILKLKDGNPELKRLYSKSLQMVNNMLWYNLRSRYGLRRKGRKTGKIRFKTEGSFRILNYNQSGFKIDAKAKRIDFSKIGTINVKLNRQIEGEVKGILIKREVDNWFVILQVEVDNGKLPKTGKSVGIDMGINNLIADSAGNLIDNPRFIEKKFAKIKMMQKNLSRKDRGSKSYEKERKRLGRQYIKVNNRRSDFLHKVSRYYINNFDTIIMEDLDGKGLIENGRNRTLHRNISDAAWRIYRNMLSYKAERAGRTVVFVDPKDTSQKCSRCNNVKTGEGRLRLHDRIYKCEKCGFESDRDYNASVNILKSGPGRPEVPSEAMPLPRRITYGYINSGQVLSMNKETHVFRRG